jgi:hypothetical protein
MASAVPVLSGAAACAPDRPEFPEWDRSDFSELTTFTAIGEAQVSQPPLMMEFEAEAGKSYVLDCDKNKMPWAWVTSEDQR